MKKNKTIKTSNDFNIRLHTVGRIWNSIILAMIIAVPIIICVYFDTLPDWGVLASSAIIGPMLINLLAGLFEPIVYAPMLGTNGMYLAFITGNLSSLKIPCVVKAQEISGTKRGTEENELVSTIAIATSSIVTVVIIAFAVLLLSVSGLETLIMNNEFLTPAFGCVVFALFGSLGGKHIAKNPKFAIPPIIVMAVISITVGLLGSQIGSVSLFVGIGLCLVSAIFQYKREKGKMMREEELRRLRSIATGMSYESLVDAEKQEEVDRLDYLVAEKEAKKKARKDARNSRKKGN